MQEVSRRRSEDEPDVDGVPVVRFVLEGAVVGSSEQEKLSSASTPLEENWTKPGWSVLIWELIQLSYRDTLA